MKYITLKETFFAGKLIGKGEIVEGDGLDKKNPDLFRRANSADNAKIAVSEPKKIGDKEIAKVMEQVKAYALAELESQITEAVMAKAEEKIEAVIAEKLKAAGVVPAADENGGQA